MNNFVTFQATPTEETIQLTRHICEKSCSKLQLLSPTYKDNSYSTKESIFTSM